MEDREVGNQANHNTRFGRRPPTDASVDWLRLTALAGLCLDGVTTWFVLVIASYRELNPVINGLWHGQPLFVAGYFGTIALVVSTVTRRRGPVSTATAAYVGFVMGVFGGLNNLLLFAFGGPSLLDVLAGATGVSGIAVVVSVVPMCGLFVAGGAVGLRHGRRLGK